MKARLLSADEVAVAAEIVREGGIVALPTDTVYGLACDPCNRESVDRLFEVKGREAKPVPVLCADVRAAQGLVDLGETGLALSKEHWPGALTIVAPMTPAAMKSIAPDVHQSTGWLGVRVPDHSTATSLARNAGGYVTGTSANLSGLPSCTSAEEVAEALGGRLDAIIDGGHAGAKESTVVRVVGETIEVLRKGSISVEQRQESQRHR
ncbi:MAG: L-threonylcarbamoyladenylate synthase [Thaumarchaeota archaeon]|nr:L-threonylcarbamoyladenylate synthase [Nitrososphaerota archaeon]